MTFFQLSHFFDLSIGAATDVKKNWKVQKKKYGLLSNLQVQVLKSKNYMLNSTFIWLQTKIFIAKTFFLKKYFEKPMNFGHKSYSFSSEIHFEAKIKCSSSLS